MESAPDLRAVLKEGRWRPSDVRPTTGRWIADTAPAAPPKSPLGQALKRFLEDGPAPALDNNGCERALRVRDVFEKLAGGWLQSRITELLPPVWAQLHAPPAPGQADVVAISA